MEQSHRRSTNGGDYVLVTTLLPEGFENMFSFLFHILNRETLSYRISIVFITERKNGICGSSKRKRKVVYDIPE